MVYVVLSIKLYEIIVVLHKLVKGVTVIRGRKTWSSWVYIFVLS